MAEKKQRDEQKPKPIVVSSNQVAAVAKWASVDETRPHLQMVCFANDEYIATDGYRMVRVPCRTHGLAFGVDAMHLIAAVAAQKALCSLPASPFPSTELKMTRHLDGANYKVRVEIRSDTWLTVPERDSKSYPPVDRVAPKGKSGQAPPAVYSVNPAYYAAVAEVLADESLDLGVDVTAWGDELDPLVLTSGRGIRFIIMPMDRSPWSARRMRR